MARLNGRRRGQVGEGARSDVEDWAPVAQGFAQAAEPRPSCSVGRVYRDREVRLWEGEAGRREVWGA